eukprot:s518_g30.t1
MSWWLRTIERPTTLVLVILLAHFVAKRPELLGVKSDWSTAQEPLPLLFQLLSKQPRLPRSSAYDSLYNGLAARKQRQCILPGDSHALHDLFGRQQLLGSCEAEDEPLCSKVQARHRLVSSVQQAWFQLSQCWRPWLTEEIVVEVLNQQRNFANLGLAALELQPAARADPLAKAVRSIHNHSRRNLNPCGNISHFNVQCQAMAPNDMHPSQAGGISHHEGEKFHSARGTGAISKNLPLSEVNRHCIPEDCWVALNGKVYDLSEFMDRHPGGPTTILAWAGKDASKFFNEIHKGVKIDSYLRPESYLGDLGVDESLMSEEFWHTLREARIVEVREEIDRVLSQTTDNLHKADSILRLLQDKKTDAQLKTKLQRLETQKRAALDSEDYAKAMDVKKEIERILADQAHVHLHDVPLDIPNVSGGIPLSEAITALMQSIWIDEKNMAEQSAELEEQVERASDSGSLPDLLMKTAVDESWCQAMAPNDMHPSIQAGGVLSDGKMHHEGEKFHSARGTGLRLGGPTTILAWAGKDASKFFNEIHKGARIVEVREEIDRVLSQTADMYHKADSIPRLLQDKNTDPQLKTKLQRLETQKRAALDSEAGHIPSTWHGQS